MGIGFLRKAKRRRRLERAGYVGPFQSWGDARSRATGYDAEVIFQRVRDATASVRDGKAAYERDSVLFNEVHHSWPLAAALLHTAAGDRRLSVLDYGGALGSSYYQNRGLLTAVGSYQWSIVEQAHFVRCGRAEFSDSTLQFYETVEEALRARKPNVVLVSSVLQYLEDPAPAIKSLAGCGAHAIVLDRMPLVRSGPSQIYVQNVPPEIYPASYPVRVLNVTELLGMFSGYHAIAEFPSYCDPQTPFEHLGFILKSVAAAVPGR